MSALLMSMCVLMGVRLTWRILLIRAWWLIPRHDVVRGGCLCMFLLRVDYIYARLDDEDEPSRSQVFGERKRGRCCAVLCCAVLCCAVLCFAAAPCIVIVIMAWLGLS